MTPAHRMTRTTRITLTLAIVAALMALAGGCGARVELVPRAEQNALDRAVVDTPPEFVLVQTARGLTAPVAFCFDDTDGPNKGTLLVAESGAGGNDVRILAIRPDESFTPVYPQRRTLPFFRRGFQMYAPVGGMVVANGKILVSHRDASGNGVISAIGYDGSHSTVVADLPARGDYAVTDLAINPVNGRLYFGLGAATNSGVVGIDNWQVGWVNNQSRFCDLPLGMQILLGRRFDTKNPRAGIWGGADIAVTGPFQAFNTSKQTRIPPAPNGKPTSAIYSCNPAGGDLRVEAHGVRLPRGIAFDAYGQTFFTNNGMELRGTRPVKDDPDVLMSLATGTWYGWPDFSADLYPIGDPRFQPPLDLILPYGYPDLSFLINHRQSEPRLESPEPLRRDLLRAVFPSQSGAAKLAIVPDTGPFRDFRGEAIIALSGDRAPFATSGQRLVGPQGFKVVAVDVDPSRRRVRDFIVNTSGQPASTGTEGGIERPVDVKFGPDGALYVLDFGRMTVHNGKEKVAEGTGAIFKLMPAEWSTTRPTTAPSASVTNR